MFDCSTVSSYLLLDFCVVVDEVEGRGKHHDEDDGGDGAADDDRSAAGMSC